MVLRGRFVFEGEVEFSYSFYFPWGPGNFALGILLLEDFTRHGGVRSGNDGTLSCGVGALEEIGDFELALRHIFYLVFRTIGAFRVRVLGQVWGHSIALLPSAL